MPVMSAREIEQRIRNADAVIVLLSAASVQSEMLAYEIQIAHEASQQRDGKPRILASDWTDTQFVDSVLHDIGVYSDVDTPGRSIP